MFRFTVHQNEFTTFGNKNRIFFFPLFKSRQLYKSRSGGKGNLWACAEPGFEIVHWPVLCYVKTRPGACI